MKARFVTVNALVFFYETVRLTQREGKNKLQKVLYDWLLTCQLSKLVHGAWIARANRMKPGPSFYF